MLSSADFLTFFCTFLSLQISSLLDKMNRNNIYWSTTSIFGHIELKRTTGFNLIRGGGFSSHWGCKEFLCSSLSPLTATCRVITFIISNICDLEKERSYSGPDPVENKCWRLPNRNWVIMVRGPDCVLATWFVIEYLSRIFFFVELFQSTIRHSNRFIVLKSQESIWFRRR